MANRSGVPTNPEDELGPAPDFGFAFDSDRLLIWLDKDGRFERHAVVGD